MIQEKFFFEKKKTNLWQECKGAHDARPFHCWWRTISSHSRHRIQVASSGRAGGVLNLKLGKLSERLCHRDRNVRTLRVGSIFTFSFQKKRPTRLVHQFKEQELACGSWWVTAMGHSITSVIHCNMRCLFASSFQVNQNSEHQTLRVSSYTAFKVWAHTPKRKCYYENYLVEINSFNIIWIINRFIWASAVMSRV